jgi:hypothetical protein
MASWFKGYVDAFRDGAKLSSPLELKRLHSLRVAENAALIAAGFGLAQEEIELARAAGLLHDAGRFSQFARYESFRDADTIDHGLEGRRVLEEAAPFADADERERLLCAVQYHNRKTEDIPPGLPASQSSLLRLVRDADKLDIMEIVLDSVEADGFKDLPVMVPNIRLSRELTPGVLDKALIGESPSSEKLSTLADFLVMLASWFFDLNYMPSRRLAAQRGILPRIRGKLPDTAGIREFFRGIKETMRVSGGAEKVNKKKH